MMVVSAVRGVVKEGTIQGEEPGLVMLSKLEVLLLRLEVRGGSRLARVRPL